MFQQISLCTVAVLLQTGTSYCTSLLPAPQGPYGVNITTLEIVDYSRQDPYALQYANITTPRTLKISVFHPLGPRHSCKTSEISYVPLKAAAFMDNEYQLTKGTFESLALAVDEYHETRKTERLRDLPVLAFSPAFGTSRLLYSSLASSVSSFGYIVVTIDHPYDVDVVEYPDGTLVISPFIGMSDEDLIGLAPDAESMRVADISFTLDQLSLSSTTEKLGLSSRGLDVSKVGAFGHSLGGATALIAMENDTRIIGGANLDGAIFGPAPDYVPIQGVTRPFLLFGSTGNNRIQGDEIFVETWGAFWNESKGYKVELELANSAHYDFSDLPLLLDVMNQTLGSAAAGNFSLGRIDGLRARKIATAYIVDFFDFVLKGKEAVLLRGESSRYPEVTFVE